MPDSTIQTVDQPDQAALANHIPTSRSRLLAPFVWLNHRWQRVWAAPSSESQRLSQFDIRANQGCGAIVTAKPMPKK